MFSHVMVGANNIEESRVFYDKIFKVLGAEPGKMYPNLSGQKRYFYNFKGTTFCITEPIDGKPATVSNGATIGFNIDNTEQGDAWHKAGIENGGISIEEAPGIRNYGKFSMYLAYLRDPTGNKLCASLLIK
jgi:catechol 2,3-dioxygenase-like lactoylglutathione lyase family enzyme|tara:strand:+ start:1033 stop:1425 length:393 start_codon:yes stop_codon:yes gene_type:complete